MAQTKEEKAAYTRQWKLEHKDKVRQYDKKHYDTHRAERIERVKKWCIANIEKVQRYQKEYQIANAQKFREQRRRRKLKKNFSISISDYESMFALQNGTCAICGGDNSGKTFAIDHDHQTGKIRSLLCDSCNLGIGFLGDDETLIQNAISYLIAHS